MSIIQGTLSIFQTRQKETTPVLTPTCQLNQDKNCKKVMENLNVTNVSFQKAFNLFFKILV